jgi:hypothetical protein
VIQLEKLSERYSLCENEWGQGPGYRDRVAQWNQEWFAGEPRQDLEQELWTVVTREWGALERLSSILEVDAAGNGSHS